MRKITLYLAFVAFVCTASFSSCSDDKAESVILPEPQPASIQCNGLNVNLKTDNDWSMSRSNKWVAFTNYDEKTQYYISWGEEAPSVKVVENGKAPSELNIKSIDFKNDGVNGTITFTDENNDQGIIIYPVWEE